MLIGELSKRSGFSRDTIRYYDKLGLIAMNMSRRIGNGYKDYPLKTLERLRHIQRLKECGFTLSEIRGLLTNDGDGHVCDDLPSRLADKLGKIDEEIVVLLEYKQSLLQIQKSCNGACSTIQGLPDCIPLESARTKIGSGG